jgi:hypothetical protein
MEICFKNIQRKYDCQNLDLHSFFEVVEQLCIKLYRPNVKPNADGEEEEKTPMSECIEMFLNEAVPFFEEQLSKQQP